MNTEKSKSPKSSHVLDHMIKKVPSAAYNHSRKYEQVIALDVKSEKAFEKKPWRNILSTYDYYWVSTADYHTVKEQFIELQDMRSGGKVRLSFDYRIKCRQGEEHLLVELVGKTENAGATLQLAILREIETCAYHKSENFLSDYDNFEGYLKEHMYGWADSNGMQLDIHLRPQLDEPDLLEGFEVTLGEAENWELPTKDSRIRVRLSISLYGKISSFGGKLGDYLKKDEKLIDKIRNVISNVAQQYIHTISPEKFYMQFESTDGEYDSVQTELSRLISDKLNELFNVEVFAVTIRQVNTALTERFQALCAGFGDFELKDNAENIHYSIQFKVEKVHPSEWPVFQSKNFGNPQSELKVIGENLCRHMKLFFDTNLSFDFQNVKNHQLNTLIRKLFAEASTRIVKDFGLVVLLTSMERSMADITSQLKDQRKIEEEKIRAKQEQEKENYISVIKSETNKINALKAQHKRALEAEDEEEAARLEKLLKKLETKLNNGTNLSKKQQKMEGEYTTDTDISHFLGDQKLL